MNISSPKFPETNDSFVESSIKYLRKPAIAAAVAAAVFGVSNAANAEDQAAHGSESAHTASYHPNHAGDKAESKHEEKHDEKAAALQTGAVVSTHGQLGVNGQLNFALGNHHGVHAEVAPVSFSATRSTLNHGAKGEWTYDVGMEAGPVFPIGKYVNVAVLGEMGFGVKDLKEHGVETELLIGGALKTVLNLPIKELESYIYLSAGSFAALPLHKPAEANEGHSSHTPPVVLSFGVGKKLF